MPHNHLDSSTIINTVAIVITAIATVASTIAAASAARSSYKAIKQTEVTQREEKQLRDLSLIHGYYRILVAEPSFSYIQDFIESTSDTFKMNQQKYIDLLARNPRQDQIELLLDNVVNEFNQHWHHLAGILTTVTSAWGSEELVQQIRASLEKLQDDVTVSLDSVNRSSDHLIEISNKTNGHGADLMKIIMQHDPAIKRHNESENS